MLSEIPSNFRIRRSFGKIKRIIEIPDLIELQKRSYEEFLQRDVEGPTVVTLEK